MAGPSGSSLALPTIVDAANTIAGRVLEFVKVDTEAGLERSRIRTASRLDELAVRGGGAASGVGRGVGSALGAIAPIAILLVVGAIGVKLLKGRG